MLRGCFVGASWVLRGCAGPPPSLSPLLAFPSITFGYKFNQSLQGVTWPASLQTIIFGYEFNQSLQGVTWPASLQTITFGTAFNQTLQGVTWPASLQTITFGYKFGRFSCASRAPKRRA